MSNSSDGANGAQESDDPQMYPRFVVVPDTPQLNLKDEGENVTETKRQIGGKECSLFKRSILSAPTWFKVDDDSKEHGKICFAKNVSPEIRECSLQNLLHEMDKKIIQTECGDDSGDESADGDAVKSRLHAFARKQVIDRTIFAYDKAASKNSASGDDEVRASDRRRGRTVFYVTVGQMKHTRITISGASPTHPKVRAKHFMSVEVDGKHVFIPEEVGTRLGDKLQETLEKRFADKKRAQGFLQDTLDDFDAAKDQDFKFIEEDDPLTVAQVMDCLVVLARNAKDNNAAIIIPDYMTSSGNSKLIENALDFVEFNGPVISISTQEQAAWDGKTASETYQIGDAKYPRGIPHNRVTHSIHIPHSSYSKVAARLAKVICEPDLDLYGDDKDELLKDGADSGIRRQRILVIAGGGFALLQHMGEAVKEGLPVVVLQGSRRLCDYLPQLWVRRFSAKFDIYEETLKLADAIGFPNAQESSMALLVRQIVEQGHVSIHQLSTGVHSLRRIL